MSKMQVGERPKTLTEKEIQALRKLHVFLLAHRGKTDPTVSSERDPSPRP